MLKIYSRLSLTISTISLFYFSGIILPLNTIRADASVCVMVEMLISSGIINSVNAENVRSTLGCSLIPEENSKSSICNDGKNYELSSNQQIYAGKIRKPTSYILPGESISLGFRNIDTGEIKYNSIYTYTTTEPSRISIGGNIAKDIVSKYEDYTLFIDINVPELAGCSNIRQPMRLMVGDPFLGQNTAFIYPKDIIPSKVLDNNQSWATISVGQMMNSFNLIKVTDVARELQEKMLAHKAIDGDIMLMGLMPTWCGGSGQPIGFGVGCLLSPTNNPQWGIIFHEMGHVVENFLGTLNDGIGKDYTNNRLYFGEIDKQNIGSYMYAEGIATLAAMYAEKNIVENNQVNNFSDQIITEIKSEYNIARTNYLKALDDYESRDSVFSTIYPDVMDGIFITLAENSSINKLGWEVFPRFFKIYQNPLPSFIQGSLSELQGHTYFIAGLSAASGYDLRYLFRDKWHFPIDDAYFAEIYPKLSSFLDNSITITTPTPTTVDKTAPLIGSGYPSGTITLSTGRNELLSVTTNEAATCRMSLTDVGFDNMSGMSTSGGTIHSQNARYLEAGKSYKYYVRCKDKAGNKNTSSYVVSFSVESAVVIIPPTPTCTSFTYSVWSACTSSIQSRTVTASAPTGCTGGDQILAQYCAITEPITPTPTTVDKTAPVISSSYPSGIIQLSAGRNELLSVITDEVATCQMSLTDVPFDNMSGMSTSGGTTHSQNIRYLENGKSYKYYIRCKDKAGNKNTSSYIVNFSIAPAITSSLDSNYSTVYVGWESFIKLVQTLK